jgi:hypothetical protein
MSATAIARHEIGHVERLGTHLVDLRDQPPDLFTDVSATDWSRVTWKDVGRPYRVEKWAAARTSWEREHGGAMPVLEGWKRFNRNFHQLFATDVPEAQRRARDELASALASLDVHGAQEALEELLHLAIWNKIHRVEDAVWDPRGKRALFAGLDVRRPRILFLGAAEGYEAMQLSAMYPGGHVVLVDYDEFCKTDRFGTFPEALPVSRSRSGHRPPAGVVPDRDGHRLRGRRHPRSHLRAGVRRRGEHRVDRALPRRAQARRRSRCTAAS